MDLFPKRADIVRVFGIYYIYMFVTTSFFLCIEPSETFKHYGIYFNVTKTTSVGGAELEKAKIELSREGCREQSGPRVLR